jgi:hypothetical protein
MRRELGAAAVKGVLDGLDTNAICLEHHESDALLAAADLVTLARTAVERDRHTRFSPSWGWVGTEVASSGYDFGDPSSIAKMADASIEE